MNFASIALWLTTAIVATSAATLKGFDITSLPDERGFLFENVGEMMYQIRTQKINFIVPLALYKIGFDYMTDTREQAKSMCNGYLQNLNISNSKKKCEGFGLSLDDSYSKLESKFNDFESTKKSSLCHWTRRKRNVGDFILNLVSMPSQSEVKQINDKSNKIIECTGILAEGFQSFMRKSSDTNLIVNKNSRRIDDTFRWLSEFFRNSTDVEVDQKLNSLVDSYRASVESVTDYAEMLTEALEEPLNSLLKKGNMTDVRAALAQIDPWNGKLPVDPSVESEVRRLLRLMVDVKACFDGEKLRYVVDVPFVFNETFVLYKLHPVPKSVRRPGGNCTERVVEMRPVDGKLYLAVTEDRRSYVGLTEVQMANCKWLGQASQPSRLCNVEMKYGRNIGVLERGDVAQWSCEYAQLMNVTNSTKCEEHEVSSRAKFDDLNSNVLLYWVDRPTGLNVTCKCDTGLTATEHPQRVLLDGVGLLSLAECCWGKAESGNSLVAFPKNESSYGLNHNILKITFLNVSLSLSKIQPITDMHVTFPNLEQVPSVGSETINKVSEVILETREKIEESLCEELLVSFGGTWYWYAAATIITCFFTHFAIKYVRKKLFYFFLGKSNAKNLKLLRKVSPCADPQISR